MPTYEYECFSCGHSFEAFQSMADAPLSICPICGKSVRRIIAGGTGIIFKGSGFYVNDSRKKSASEPAAESSKPAAQSSKPAAESSTAKAKESA